MVVFKERSQGIHDQNVFYVNYNRMLIAYNLATPSWYKVWYNHSVEPGPHLTSRDLYIASLRPCPGGAAPTFPIVVLSSIS